MKVLKIRVDGKDEMTLRVQAGQQTSKAIEKRLTRDRGYKWCSVDRDGYTDFSHLPFYRYRHGVGGGSIVVLSGGD